jgi:hypothetical protein
MIYRVRIWLKLAAFGLLLIIMSMPVMACMLPTAQLSSSEHECCQKMAMNCGSAAMPSSHSCCQPQVRSADYLLVGQFKLSRGSQSGALQGYSVAPFVHPWFAFSPADVEAVSDSPPGAAVTFQILRI